LYALLVGPVISAVLNAKPAKLEKQHTATTLVIPAKIVVWGNIARAVWKLPLVAKIVPLVLIKVMKDRRRAYHAVQVNSTMLTVQLHANHVQRRRILVKKEETVVVFIVPWDGHLIKVQLVAAGVILVNSAVKRVNVLIAQQDDTKTAKEKHRAKTAMWTLT
jgi:hypothetical protein